MLRYFILVVALFARSRRRAVALGSNADTVLSAKAQDRCRKACGARQPVGGRQTARCDPLAIALTAGSSARPSTAA
jgi:hypothetical protein